MNTKIFNDEVSYRTCVCGIVLVKIIQTDIYKYDNGQKFIIRNVQILTNSPYKVPKGLTILPTVY